MGGFAAKDLSSYQRLKQPGIFRVFHDTPHGDRRIAKVADFLEGLVAVDCHVLPRKDAARKSSSLRVIQEIPRAMPGLGRFLGDLPWVLDPL